MKVLQINMITNDKNFYIGDELIELRSDASHTEKVRHEFATRIPVAKVIVEIPIDDWDDMMSDFGVLEP